MSEREPQPDNSKQPLTGRQEYNEFTDLVVGPNVRLKDNLFQFLFIVACVPLGVGVGFLITKDRLTGMLVGGAIGLLVGLFGSGIFLMVYRAICHARGRHD